MGRRRQALSTSPAVVGRDVVAWPPRRDEEEEEDAAADAEAEPVAHPGMPPKPKLFAAAAAAAAEAVEEEPDDPKARFAATSARFAKSPRSMGFCVAAATRCLNSS